MDPLACRDVERLVQSNVSDFVQIFKADDHAFDGYATPPKAASYRTPKVSHHKLRAASRAAEPAMQATIECCSRCTSGAITTGSQHKMSEVKNGHACGTHAFPCKSENSLPAALAVDAGSAVTLASGGCMERAQAHTLTHGSDNCLSSGANCSQVPALKPDQNDKLSCSDFDGVPRPLASLHRAGTMVPSSPRSEVGSTGKWNNLSAITECIIKEKDMIIERQKLKRIQLENQLRQCEAQLSAVIVARATDSCAASHTDDLAVHEREYEKSVRHASSLATASSMAKVVLEKSQLESRLGEAEREIAGLHAKHLADSKSAQEKEERIAAKLADRDSVIASLQLRIQQMSGKMAAKKQKLKSLRRYLTDLPTAEDHHTVQLQLRDLQEELAVTKEHVDALRKKLDQSQELLRSRGDELRDATERLQAAHSRISDQERQVTELQDRENLRQASGKADIVKLMSDLAALGCECDKLSKVVLQKEEKSRQQEAERLQQEARNAELRMEADILADAVRMEAEERERQVGELVASLRQASQRNQDLMEELMTGRDKVAAAQKLLSSPERSMAAQAVDAVVCCTDSLEQLVAAVMERASGGTFQQDGGATCQTAAAPTAPRAALPLLLTSSAGSSRSSSSSNNAAEESQLLRAQLSRLDSAKNTLNKIHRLMINKCAEEMALSSGTDCITQ